jgi:mRNA interferase MazF
LARILRGEVRWANLQPTIGHEQAGRRPVLILSENVFNQRSGTVIGVALTSQSPSAGFPLTLELESSELPKQSWVKISQIRTLSTKRIGKKLGVINPEEIVSVIEGLNEILGA